MNLGLYIENGDCGGYTSFETDRFFTPDFIVKNEELIFDELTNAAKLAITLLHKTEIISFCSVWK